MITTMNPTQVANDPETFARVFLRILDKKRSIVPLVWNQAQADFHRNRTGHDLILKARQLGFSTYVQGEMYRRTVTGTRTTITLAHDTETTQKLRRMADRFHKYCRFGDLQPERHFSNATLSTYPEFDSTAVIATAGSLNAGRGDTYSDFHGSEVAFWPDAEKIVAGAMQGGSPDVILESTPNGAQGYFYERCMEALRGDGVWKLHFYPWWWDRNYRVPLDDGEFIEYTADEAPLVEKYNLVPEQIKWRRLKQRELKHLFIQEYPEDPYTCFITSGKSYFGDLSKCFTAPAAPLWNATHRYQGGLDFGQANDFTAMPIIDKTTNEQVDLLHINGLEWKEIRNRIRQTSERWTRSTCEDGHKTRGVNLVKDEKGKPILTDLGLKQYICPEPGCGKTAKLLRPTIRAEKNSIGQVNIEILQEDGLDIIPFETTNATKAEVMAELHEALHAEQKPLKLQDHPVQRHELTTMVSVQLPSGVWRLAAEGDGHDDTVIGLSLANTDSASGWIEYYRNLADQQKQQEN
jgi:hypothetical protein